MGLLHGSLSSWSATIHALKACGGINLDLGDVWLYTICIHIFVIKKSIMRLYPCICDINMIYMTIHVITKHDVAGSWIAQSSPPSLTALSSTRMQEAKPDSKVHPGFVQPKFILQGLGGQSLSNFNFDIYFTFDTSRDVTKGPLVVLSRDILLVFLMPTGQPQVCKTYLKKSKKPQWPQLIDHTEDSWSDAKLLDCEGC